MVDSLLHAVNLTAARAEAERAGLQLRDGPTGLELALPGGPAVTAACDLLVKPRPGAADPLWRATLSGRGPVLDATAGLGADAFHLAAKGAQVTMIERSPVLAALLADALRRAGAGTLGEAAREAASRLSLLHGDATQLLGSGSELTADVVYLDPMFANSGRQAAPPKGMAVLRRLFAEAGKRLAAEEELALLTVARRAAGKRVVVKRALKAAVLGAPLARAQPSGALRGRTVRYDLYAPL